jgi:hypothetical protein
MADSILGLPSSKKFQDEADRFNGHRRKILHLYPNGGATLTGILSMLPTEDVTDSIHNWYEKRYQSPNTTLRGTNPVTSDAPSTGDADDGTNATTGAKAVTASWYFKVASTKDFKVGDVFIIDTQSDLQFWVDSITRGVTASASNGYLRAKLVRAATFGVIATIFASGTTIRKIGNAHGEGASGTGQGQTAFKRPYAVMNTTQIFRDKMEFPRSVLKMGLKYDKTGPYKERAKDLVIEHMTGIERTLIWGRRATVSRTSFDSSQEDLSVRHMSGIIEYLELWDAGSTGLTIDGATYAPYAFKSASTLDTDDNKRVIANTSGVVTVKKWNRWAELVGRYNTNRSKDKLVLCGNGALSVFAEMFRLNTTMKVNVGDSAYGLDFMTLVTPFGKFHFVSHPLFNEQAAYQNWALILDIWSLRFRPLLDSDTRLLKMRQNPGDDFRRDEYLTEALLEFWFPERHMLIKNITTYQETE